MADTMVTTPGLARLSERSTFSWSNRARWPSKVRMGFLDYVAITARSQLTRCSPTWGRRVRTGREARRR